MSECLPLCVCGAYNVKRTHVATVNQPWQKTTPHRISSVWTMSMLSHHFYFHALHTLAFDLNELNLVMKLAEPTIEANTYSDIPRTSEWSQLSTSEAYRVLSYEHTPLFVNGPR